MKYRNEFDSIGKIKVPGDKYWGASTQRSNKYFDIGDFLVRPIVIQSIAIIKKAAAIVNARNGDLDKKLSKYIIKSSDEIIHGKHADNFPFHFQNLFSLCHRSPPENMDRISVNIFEKNVILG